MKTITVTASKGYCIHIGPGLLEQCGELIAKAHRPCTAALITDDRVAPLYAQRVEASLQAAGFTTCRFVFPNGERAKNAATLLQVYDFLAEAHITRSDLIVALGGGVVGDLAGFAAATYLRGIAFVQLPTTLLAAVDSSVGGKTGIDLTAGKNLVGAFWQPSLVVCDTDTFDTLPPAVFADGVAEVIKYGVMTDPALFEQLEAGELQTRLQEIVCRCVEIKRDVVQRDERESGERQLLNLGHTLGHAVEKLSDYAISHGHAVSIGMVAIAKAAAAAGLCDANCPRRVAATLTRYNLPTRCPYPARELAQAALADKKRSGSTITLVIPHKVGQSELYPLPIEQLEAFIAAGL